MQSNQSTPRFMEKLQGAQCGGESCTQGNMLGDNVKEGAILCRPPRPCHKSDTLLWQRYHALGVLQREVTNTIKSHL